MGKYGREAGSLLQGMGDHCRVGIGFFKKIAVHDPLSIYTVVLLNLYIFYTAMHMPGLLSCFSCIFACSYSVMSLLSLTCTCTHMHTVPSYNIFSPIHFPLKYLLFFFFKLFTCQSPCFTLGFSLPYYSRYSTLHTNLHIYLIHTC